jgi:hypothetical protein
VVDGLDDELERASLAIEFENEKAATETVSETTDKKEMMAANGARTLNLQGPSDRMAL